MLQIIDAGILFQLFLVMVDSQIRVAWTAAIAVLQSVVYTIIYKCLGKGTERKPKTIHEHKFNSIILLPIECKSLIGVMKDHFIKR